MKKKSLLWISAFLLMLAGCSSDDDITTNDKIILGYWESTGTIDGRSGLLFTSDGEIKYWDYSAIMGHTYVTDKQYFEQHWGYFWFDDDGTLEIQDRPKGSDPNPDEMYYKVMSLTKDRLVIRHFGGFAGTPLEKGSDVVYKKIDKPY
jgi:uncharacterized protein YcfL